MKKIFLLSIMMFVCAFLFAQHSLEKVWQTDSPALRNPESVFYDSKSNSLYVSNTGSGSIAQVGVDGKVIKSDWVTGLSSNKGLGLIDGLLYAAESSGVAVIDVEKASVVKRIPIQGAQMLNDVAVDSKGIVYVSDTRAGRVYRIEGDAPAVYLENMPGANGLMTVNTDLYVLTSTSIQKVNANKQITKIADGFENGLDGIVMIAENEFLISNYQGVLYYVKADGTRQLLLDSRANGVSANDISFDSKTNTVYVPSYFTNCVNAYKVK